MSRTSMLPPSTQGYVARQDMPQHLSILFRARPPLEQAIPIPKGHCKPLTGYFDEYRDYFGEFEKEEPPKQLPIEKPEEKKKRLKIEKLVSFQLFFTGNSSFQSKEENIIWYYIPFVKSLTSELKHIFIIGNPYKDTNIRQSEKDKDAPFKTIFVSNLSYNTDERKLKKEFEIFGPIRRIRVVVDQKTGKSRGYSFIEYESEKDYQLALDKGHGRRVDGRRVNVDYERGRTKQDWLPRRLGGGRGDTRRNRDQEKVIRDLKKSHPLFKSKSRSRSQDKIKPQKSQTQEIEETKQIQSTASINPQTIPTKSNQISSQQIDQEHHHRHHHSSHKHSEKDEIRNTKESIPDFSKDKHRSHHDKYSKDKEESDKKEHSKYQDVNKKYSNVTNDEKSQIIDEKRKNNRDYDDDYDRKKKESRHKNDIKSYEKPIDKKSSKFSKEDPNLITNPQKQQNGDTKHKSSNRDQEEGEINE